MVKEIESHLVNPRSRPRSLLQLPRTLLMERGGAKCFTAQLKALRELSSGRVARAAFPDPTRHLGIPPAAPPAGSYSDTCYQPYRLLLRGRGRGMLEDHVHTQRHALCSEERRGLPGAAGLETGLWAGGDAEQNMRGLKSFQERAWEPWGTR